MFEAGVQNLITTDPPTMVLIGTRLYPVQGVPANPTYPYATYQDITGHAEYSLTAENDVRRIQFDIWGEAYGDGRAIILALRNLLSGFSGTLNDGTYVIFANRLNVMDSFDVNQRAYRSIVEYEFQFSEL